MKPDFLADELPFLGEKGRAAREARSPMISLGWLSAVALVGFAATSAAIQFGPGAVEYLKELASRSFEVAPNSAPATVPKFQPFWVSENPPVASPPSIQRFNIPQGNGFAIPSPGGRVNASGFTIHR